MSDNKSWVESIRAGDEVAITDAFGKGYTIAKVTRTTATQVVVPGYNGTMRRFRRDEWAREIGGGSAYHYSRLQPLTDEVRAAIERDELVQWLIWLTTTSAGSRAMKLPELRAMKAAYKAPELVSIAKSVAAIGFHTIPGEDACRCSRCALVREAQAAMAKVNAS